MKKKLTLVLAVMAMMFLVAPCPAPAMALSWDDDPLCKKLTDPAERELAGCNNTGDIFDKVPGAVTAVFSVAGIVAAGVIIFGGVRYSISQGDPGKVKKAKDTIMYAVVGLMVTLLAFTIVIFVLGGI